MSRRHKKYDLMSPSELINEMSRSRRRAMFWARVAIVSASFALAMQLLALAIRMWGLP